MTNEAVKPVFDSVVVIEKVFKMPNSKLMFRIVSNVTNKEDGTLAISKVYTDKVSNLEDIFDDAERWGKDMAQKLDVEYYL